VSKAYKVIGSAAVAGVEPGGTVSQEELERARAIVEPLLGVHLEEIKDEPAPTARAAKAKAESDK